MRRLQAAVSNGLAWRRLQGRGPGRWLRRLRHRWLRTSELADLPYLELFGMPKYLVRFTATAAPAPELKGRELEFLVWGPDATVTPCTLLGTIGSDYVRADGMAPPVSAETALSRARAALTTLLARRGARSQELLNALRASVEPIQYPYWVYYYERRRGQVDVRLLDALTGRPTGGKVKTALLAAFQNAPRRAHPPLSS